MRRPSDGRGGVVRRPNRVLKVAHVGGHGILVADAGRKVLRAVGPTTISERASAIASAPAATAVPSSATCNSSLEHVEGVAASASSGVGRGCPQTSAEQPQEDALELAPENHVNDEVDPAVEGHEEVANLYQPDWRSLE